jgi:hypothetical protein
METLMLENIQLERRRGGTAADANVQLPEKEASMWKIIRHSAPRPMPYLRNE